MNIISFEEFSKVEIRSGCITRVESFDRAKNPSYKIWANFGKDFGILQTAAQVTVRYAPERLLNKQIIGVLNLGERNIAGFMSQFLLLGFKDKNGAIVLAIPDIDVDNGEKIC